MNFVIKATQIDDTGKETGPISINMERVSEWWATDVEGTEVVVLSRRS